MPRKPKASIEALSAAVADSAAPAPKKRATPKKATPTGSAVKSTAAPPKTSATAAQTSETSRAAKPKTSSKSSRAAESNATSAAAFDANSYHEDIARLAYHFWEQRGRVEGSPEEDWLRAEQEWRRTVLLESA